MKKYPLREHYQKEFGEFVLGPREVGSSVGYLASGEMGAGETRKLSPGAGHEEIILVIGGSAESGGVKVETGEAFYIPSGDEVVIKAGPSGCRYVSAGAHTEDHGHGH